MERIRDWLSGDDDDDGERVDGQRLEPLDELGSDDRLLRGLLLRAAAGLLHDEPDAG